MIVTAIAPWYGAKRVLAPRIVAEMGPHCAYWELCSGSLAITLAKPVAPMETAVDLHGDITNLARVLADEQTALALYERAARFLMVEDLLAEASDRVAGGEVGESPDVTRAADYLYLSWVGINGLSGLEKAHEGRRRVAVRFTAGGGAAATRWRSVIESIPAWHARLQNVLVLRRDIFEVLPRIGDEDGMLIYVDPPYVAKGGKYPHDMALADHVRLSGELRRFTKTRVLVSYYDHPLVRDNYQGWTIVDLSTRKNLVAQVRRGEANDATAPELLLINGPSVAEAASLFSEP